MRQIYGIDLGTTNSLCALNGELLTGLIPSVVNLTTGTAGKEELHNTQAARSFKCDISLFDVGYRSLVASSRVLAEVVKESGNDVKEVVISVPAYFSDNQRNATIKAAEMVGLKVAGIINEPTAAAIYASSKQQALTLVFDLGGGTFDVSVVDSRFGDYDVQATDGCVLGGDNLDESIRRWALKEADVKIHRLTPDDLIRLKWRCCDLKLRIQKSRKPEELDMTEYGAGVVTLTPTKYKELMEYTFQACIPKTLRVIGEAIPRGSDYNIVLVGGSTRCPYLREWLTSELGKAPMELFYDPDRIVAQGASLYASMLAEGIADKYVSDVTKAVSLALEDGTAKVIIERNSKVPIEETVFCSASKKTSQLQLALYQGDNIFYAKNEYIGELQYDYGREVEAGDGEVVVTVRVDVDGTIHLKCKELLGIPQEVTLQRNAGWKQGN